MALLLKSKTLHIFLLLVLSFPILADNIGVEGASEYYYIEPQELPIKSKNHLFGSIDKGIYSGLYIGDPLCQDSCRS